MSTLNNDSGFSPSGDVVQIHSPAPFPQGIGFIHRNVKSTIFWVGEEPSDENNFISNEVSAWDRSWLENFGGVDDPENREGYFPNAFSPRENPFYFALPYNHLDESNNLKESVKQIPWYNSGLDSVSQLKNRWIWVEAKNKICFAQWEDVGPGETDDFEYVFGEKAPKNSFSAIDLSPAVRDCLDIGNRSIVTWQFIDEKNVPEGPWKQIVTR